MERENRACELAVVRDQAGAWAVRVVVLEQVVGSEDCDGMEGILQSDLDFNEADSEDFGDVRTKGKGAEGLQGRKVAAAPPAYRRGLRLNLALATCRCHTASVPFKSLPVRSIGSASFSY